MNKQIQVDDITIYFTYGYHKFKLIISNLDRYENFSMSLYKNYENNTYLSEQPKVFDTWIDRDGGEVTGNCRIYYDGYDDVIDYCYKVFNSLIAQ